MPNKDKIRKAYDLMNEHYDMGTPEEFEEQMNDAGNREIVFKTLQEHYRLDNAPDQNAFDELMGYGLNAGAQDEQPQQPAQYQAQQVQNGGVDAATGVSAKGAQRPAQATQRPQQKQPTNYVEASAQNQPTYYETATGAARPQYGTQTGQQPYNVAAPETNEEIEANYVNGEGFGVADENYGQFAYGQHMNDMQSDVERMKQGWEAQATSARKQKSLGEEARNAYGQQRFEAANARGMAEAAGRLEAQKYGQKVVGVMAQAVDKVRAEIEEEQKANIQNQPAGQYDWLTKDHFTPRANEKMIIDRVVNSMDENQLNELINERYGKDFSDLSEKEQQEAMKMLEEYAWQALGKDYQTDSALDYIIGSMATGNLISRLNQARSDRKKLDAMAQERYGKSYNEMVEEDQKVKDEVSERMYGKKMEDLEEDEMRRVSDYLNSHYDLKSDALASELSSHSTTGLYQQGLSQYEAGLSGWTGAAVKGAAGFATMVADSVPFMVAGGIGGFFGNMTRGAFLGRALAGVGGQFERAVIMKGVLNSAKTQAVNSMVASGLTFGLYDAASAGVQSYASGNFSFGDMVMAGTKGFGKGALLGGMNTALHKMGERYATAEGKAGVAKRVGISAGGYAGEVAFFTAMEQIEKNGLTFDNFDWASVGEQAVLIGLMKMKGEAGKEETWKDPKKIIENWRKPIAKELQTDLTKEDIETLVSLGYGKKSKSLEEWVNSLYALSVNAETGQSRRADLEGALMDAQVPLEIRRKILYGYGVVTPEAMAWSASEPVEETSEAGNKTWTVTSYTENSKPLQVKRFANKREAEAWAENIKNGQVKNHITMMEQMAGPREKEIMSALYEMSKEGADTVISVLKGISQEGGGSLRQLIKSFNAVMTGKGTEAEKAMVNEAIERAEGKIDEIRTSVVEQARENVGWDTMLEEALKKEPEEWTKEERERIENYRAELRKLDDEVSLDPRVRMMNRVTTPEGNVIQATGADGQVYYVAKGVVLKDNGEIDMEATKNNAFGGAVLVYDQNGENPRWMKQSELGQWNVAQDASTLRDQLMKNYDVNYGAQVGNIVKLRNRMRRADGVIVDEEKEYKVLYVAENGTVRLEATDGSGEIDSTQERIEYDYMTQQQYEAERIKQELMSKPMTAKDVEKKQKQESAGTAFAGGAETEAAPVAEGVTGAPVAEQPQPAYAPAAPMPVDENLPEGHIAEIGTKIQYYDPKTDELKTGTYAGPGSQPYRHKIVDERGNLLRNPDGSAVEMQESDIILPKKAEAVMPEAAPVAEEPATENVNGTVTAPENTKGAGMPLNAKGKPDPIGNGVTPERALQYFEQELGMEPGDAKTFVAGMVKRAGEDMEKIIKKRPDPAKFDDPMDLQQAIAEWTAQGKALREVENRWKAIAGEIKAREDAAKAKEEAIRQQMAAEEQARIDKIREEQLKETQERERKHREFMAELERKRQEQEALEAEQAAEELTGDQMAEQAVLEEQKRRERMRIGQRLAEVGQLTDLDQPADEAMAAQVAYLSPDFKVTPESLRLELGSNFGKFGREGMLRLADNNGRTISEIADAITQAAGYDENGQWKLDANKVREELIKCIQEGSAQAIEALEKRVGIGTDRPEDRPEYWTPEKIAEYEARQKELEGMTEVQRQIAEASEMVNTSPTDAQKEAGNYKKGHVKLDGMEISIEQPKGSTRSGVDADGLPWAVRMNNTYGYIRGTKGKDKDHIDIFLSDNPEEGSVFVVDQIDPRTGEFDEHKVMYGFNSLEEAREAYLSNYMSDWQGLGNITEVNKTAFKVWLSESVHKTKPFADYRLVKAEQAKMGIERGYDESRDPFAADRTNEFLNGNEGLETIEEAPFRSILKPIEIPADMPEHMVKAGNDAVEMGKKLHTKVNICWDMSQIPEDARAYKALHEGKQVGGWYSAKDGEVYLYMPHLESPEEVMKTLLHETVAHRGMREMFGEDFETMLDNVYKYASEDLKKSIDAYWKEMGFTSQRQAVDEYIAKIAEEGPQSYQDKTLLSKVKGFIINALRKMGFDMGNYRLTDDDIRYMLAKSHDYMQYEKTDMESEYKPKSQIEKLGGEKEFVVDPFASRFDSVKPVGTGEFGNIYNQFKGRANDAVKFLLQNKDGEALGALHHDYVGEIDIVYGNDKGGLKKIARKHPEVLDDLQEILDKLPVTVESENKIKLEDDKHMVVISKGIFGNNMDKRWLLTAYEKKETGASGGSVNIDPEPTGKQNGTAPLQNTLVSGGKDTNNSSIDQENREISDLDTPFSIRKKEEPKKKGIGYKVFYRNPKDGKLYPPMVANPNGADTPVGVWLDADAAPIVGQTKTGRNQVKAGGKGTQGGSGQLAYRPGWHLGEIPYALQFGRLNPETGKKDLFPKDFVWAEVEYAADKDYQDEAYQAGINANGKYQHSLAGLPHLPEDGYYRYRTNPNPETDPWIITGAMKVNRVLSNDEVDDLVRKAGREPQKREPEGGETTLTAKNDEVKVWTSTRLKKLFKGLDGVDEQTKNFCSVSIDIADNINEVKTSLDKSYMGQPHVSEIKVTVPKSMTYEKDGEMFVRTSDINDAISRALKEASDFAKANERKMVRDESTIGTGNDELLDNAHNTRPSRYDEDTVKLDENNYVDAMYTMSTKYTNRVHDELQSLKDMVSYNKDGLEVNTQRLPGHVGQFEYTHIGQNDIVGYKKVSKNGSPYDPVYGRDLYKAQWEKLEKPMQEYKEFYERMAEKAPYPWMKQDLMSKARGVEMRMERMKQLAEGVEPTNTQFGRWAASDNGSNSVRYRDYEGEDPKLENVNNAYNEQLSKYTPENADSIVLDLGTPSEILKKAGVEDKPMKLYGSKIAKKMKKHGFEANDLRDLPRAMANPIAVFDNYNKEGNRSVLTELEIKDGNILVAVDLGKGGDIDFNIIASAFGKDTEKIEAWLSKGYATYINNEKVQNYLHLAAPIAAASDNAEPLSGAKVGKNGELNKFLGEKLYIRTENFKNWFGDWQKNPKNASKVVDKNGEPLVVYHGAQHMEMYIKDGRPYTRYTEPFTVFKDGKGFFTSDRDAAESFARGKQGMYATYLDMKKPFVIDCQGKDWDAIEGYENPDGYTRVTTDYIVNDIKRNHPEYDGVIFKNVMNENSGVVEYPIDDYVPFKAEQIKSAADITRYYQEGIKPQTSTRFNRVYHGSAADFDAFDHKFMGSGEGSRVYGWGTYVSENDKVAKDYAIIAKRNADYDLQATKSGLDIEENQVLTRIQMMENRIKRAKASGKSTEEQLNAYNEMLKYAKDELEEIEQKRQERYKDMNLDPKRRLYHVEIPDDNGKNYLDWNDAVSTDMLGRIKEEAAKEGYEDVADMVDYYTRNGEISGGDLYNKIIANGLFVYERVKQADAHKEASKLLNNAGIVGVKVPTNNLRDGDKSKNNYVIFDEKNAKIVSKEYFRRGEGVKPTVKPEEVTEAAKGMAEKLHKEVKVCQNADEISDESVKAAVKKAEAEGRTPTRKGWFNTRTGEIEVYAPAAESVEDVQKTVLHETVGHYGLRELLSDNEHDYNNAMVEMYRLMNKDQKAEVLKLMSDRKYDVATAMDEYLAKMAEDRSNMVDPGFWEKAKSVVKNLLRKIGIDVELTDGDLKYLLWSSHEALKNSREVTNPDGSKSRVYDHKTMDQKAADWAMRWHNDVLGLRSKWEAERKAEGRGTEATVQAEANVSEEQARKAAEEAVKNRDTDPDDDPTTPGGGGSPSPTGGRERSLEEMIEYDAQEFGREFNRMKNEQDQIVLGARVREFIRNRMTPLAGKRMTASDINGLLRDVDMAITHKNKKGLERALDRMQTLIHQAEGLAQIEEMMKTLNTRTTTQDKRGMVKGVLVDETANEVLTDIKSSYKQMLSTSYDERLSEVRLEMRALKEQYGITRQDDPKAPEEFKAKMQELKDKQETLKAEREGVVNSQIDETVESLKAMEDDIRNQIGNLSVNEDGDAVTAKPERLAKLEQKLITLEIRKQLAELRQMMKAKQEIQKEHTQTGSPKERHRLEKEIDKMQRRINGTSRDITEKLKDVISEGRSRRAEWVKADIERQMKIVRMGCNAERDADVPDTLDKKNGMTTWGKVSNWAARQRDMHNSPLFSFNFMAKYIDHNNAQGEGEFYDYFMRSKNGALEANNKMSKGNREFAESLNNKTKEIFGKGFDKVKAEASKLTDKKIFKLKAEKSIPEEEWDEKYVRMTKGQMLYAWLSWRQEAGRTKMEADGWTKRSIDEMEEQLGPEMLELGRWITDDFLKALRDDKYNVTYEKVMGTSMHKANHYFPLRIDKLSIQDKSEVGQDGTINLLPSASSGNLIVRTTNRMPVDLSNDAFEVLMDYGRTMERWNAMAELTKDLNTLIKSQGFRNLMEANHEGLFDRWKDACAVATASYKPKGGDDIDDALSTLHNGFMQQAIGFGYYTAIKQTLSAPAFWLYSWNPKYWGTEIWYGNVFRTYQNYQWAKENLPSFAERIAANDFGIEAINDKSLVDYLTRKFKQGGMFANKLVDAMTVANGARGVYEYDRRRFKKMLDADGNRKYTDDQAEELAKVNAQIVFNESQQSSRNEFSAPIQKDRGIMARSATAFQNSNIGYRRMMVEGLEDIFRKDGNMARGFAKVLTVGILNAAWYMGLNPALTYNYFTGKTDDEEDKKFWSEMLKSVVLGYVANGTILGPAMTAWTSEFGTYNPIQVFDLVGQKLDDAKKQFEKEDMGAMTWAIIDNALKFGGVNLEKFDGMWNGVYNAIKRGDVKADDILSILNMARTQRRELAEHGYDKPITEYIDDVMNADKKVMPGDRGRAWWGGDAYNKEITEKRAKEIVKTYMQHNQKEWTPYGDQLEEVSKKAQELYDQMREDPENRRRYAALKSTKTDVIDKKSKMGQELWQKAMDEALKDNPELHDVLKRFMNSKAGPTNSGGGNAPKDQQNETYQKRYDRLKEEVNAAAVRYANGEITATTLEDHMQELDFFIERLMKDVVKKQ